MSWTTPKTWTAGEILTAANMNTHVRDNLKFLFTGATAADMPRLYIDGGNAVSFTANVAKNVSFDSVQEDTDSGWNPSANNYVVPIDGVYLVHAAITGPFTNASTYRAWVGWGATDSTHESAQLLNFSPVTVSASEDPAFCLVHTPRVNATDRIAIKFSSDSSQTITPGASLGITYLHP